MHHASMSSHHHTHLEVVQAQNTDDEADHEAPNVRRVAGALAARREVEIEVHDEDDGNDRQPRPVVHEALGAHVPVDDDLRHHHSDDAVHAAAAAHERAAAAADRREGECAADYTDLVNECEADVAVHELDRCGIHFE